MRHIETAVSMYNAVEVLYPYFQQHCTGTSEERIRRRSIIIPIVVSCIFGIEVGIKALIEKQGEEAPHSHDLLDLYRRLQNPIRENIEKNAEIVASNQFAVEALLTAHRNSFEEWRYMGDFSKSLVVDLTATAVTLRAIIDVHSEVYGTGPTAGAQDQREGSTPPQSIQDAASEYERTISATNAGGGTGGHKDAP